MAFNIQEIRSQLVLDGARASHFQVTIQNPVEGAADLKVPFLTKASQIPASTLNTIEVPYFGRKMKIAGDRDFAEWTITVINDEDFLIRNAMEAWSNSINSHENNQRDLGSASPLLYKSQGQVTQLSKTGIPIREYTFYGLWPSNIAEIDVDWSSADTIQEFQVTFQYDWWEVSGGITGRPNGN